MKSKLLITFGLLFLGIALVGLNAASYTQKPKEADSERNPNRSSYNSGATGTQAFYTLLAETGRSVTRWQQPPAALLVGKNSPSVFVVVGYLQRSYTEAEIRDLLDWVSAGGRLVMIDRVPNENLVKTSVNWKLDIKPTSQGLADVDPSDVSAMTQGIAAARPGQPTAFTNSVNAIQPSRFAADITFERLDGDSANAVYDAEYDQESPPPAAQPALVSPAPVTSTPDSVDAPVVHFKAQSKNIVVDAPYGQGSIIFVSDPYLVSNGGISLVDNAQMALNLVSAGTGVVAFDEYHQGFGANNRLLEYFAGTPVPAILLQCVAIVGFVFYSRSRRFARPLPDAEPDRLSKLEYVAAMAELQQRTRAYDLAIENVYREFRRRASKVLGLVSGPISTKELASRIAERASLDSRDVEETLNACEQIIFGEPSNKREVLEMTKQIRQIEQKLGLSRRKTGA